MCWRCTNLGDVQIPGSWAWEGGGHGIQLTQHLVQEGNGVQGWGLSQQDPGKRRKDWEWRNRRSYKAYLRLHQFFK